MPEPTAKPNCPYCGSGDMVISGEHSGLLGERPDKGSVQSRAAKLSKEEMMDRLGTAGAPKCCLCGGPMELIASGHWEAYLLCPSCKVNYPIVAGIDLLRGSRAVPASQRIDRDALLRLASDMQIRSELDGQIGRSTVRRWARRIVAAVDCDPPSAM